jgi:hypothetical protein
MNYFGRDVTGSILQFAIGSGTDDMTDVHGFITVYKQCDPKGLQHILEETQWTGKQVICIIKIYMDFGIYQQAWGIPQKHIDVFQATVADYPSLCDMVMEDAVRCMRCPGLHNNFSNNRLLNCLCALPLHLLIDQINNAVRYNNAHAIDITLLYVQYRYSNGACLPRL